MPIRFRCAYCNQLLGIARRKAGTVVRCPTCAGQVVVPNVETNEPEGEPGEEKQLIFERSDFDELLNPEGIDAATGQMKPKLMTSSEEPIVVTSAMAPPGKTIQADPSHDVKPALSSAAPPMAQPNAAQDAGIFITRARATLLMVLAVVALALAFAGGVLVGYFLRPPESAPAPTTLFKKDVFASGCSKVDRAFG